jgi:hypothetical protein
MAHLEDATGAAHEYNVVDWVAGAIDDDTQPVSY